MEFPSRSEKTIQQSFTKAFEVIGTIKITSTASTAQFTMRPYEVHDTLCPTSVAYGPIILRYLKALTGINSLESTKIYGLGESVDHVS